MPALGSALITGPRLNPAPAKTAQLALPKRRAGFQVVHYKLTALKGITTVSSTCSHPDNLLAHCQAAHAVDHSNGFERPALLGLLHNRRNALFSHAGIVL